MDKIQVNIKDVLQTVSKADIEACRAQPAQVWPNLPTEPASAPISSAG